KDKPFALLTAHRPNNTDTLEALSRVCELLKNAPMPVVFPVHPRTEVALKKHGLLESLKQIPHVHLLPPLGYLEVLQLLNHCQIVLTDSGGLQKEGFFAGKPVVILFFATPWPQIESCGWQKLCWKDNGIDVNQALEDMVNYRPTQERPSFFGDGRAASHIVDALEQQPWWNKSLVDLTLKNIALKNEKQALLKEVSPVS
ncbi:MAG: UDP-N-acetyl glucosamine 2-epimerase, partial [Cyanobacteria bacterium]|nr:UDP-N-acetyl glucosamine 2-epimerase [Cyanobacteriota bacterium]